jgi:hypothetical protein
VIAGGGLTGGVNQPTKPMARAGARSRIPLQRVVLRQNARQSIRGNPDSSRISQEFPLISRMARRSRRVPAQGHAQKCEGWEVSRGIKFTREKFSGCILWNGDSFSEGWGEWTNLDFDREN